jgi:hypothetical protein
MHPQSSFLTCFHSTHVYHPLAGSPSKLKEKVIGFIGDRKNSWILLPIKLLPLDLFKFKQLEAVDNTEEVEDAHEESGATSTLWTPPEGANKQPITVP